MKSKVYNLFVLHNGKYIELDQLDYYEASNTDMLLLNDTIKNLRKNGIKYRRRCIGEREMQLLTIHTHKTTNNQKTTVL